MRLCLLVILLLVANQKRAEHSEFSDFPSKKETRMNRDDFYRRVYRVVRRIPTGKVTTYGAIAEQIGARNSSRMVGYALHGVEGDMDVPCHRVVNRNGELTGKMHFATPTLMRDLLESEGVTFRGDVVDMKLHFWQPGKPRKKR